VCPLEIKMKRGHKEKLRTNIEVLVPRTDSQNRDLVSRQLENKLERITYNKCEHLCMQNNDMKGILRSEVEQQWLEPVKQKKISMGLRGVVQHVMKCESF
jgi:hypothetical protein